MRHSFSLPKSVFARPKGHESEADFAHRQFKESSSDALTFLSVWKAYAESGYSRGWCHNNFLNSRSLWEAKSIREQLIGILFKGGADVAKDVDEDAVLKSVAAGLIWNLFMGSRWGRSYTYRPFLNGTAREMFIHPGSAMFALVTPRFVVANELVETTRPYMRGCSIVRPEWLPGLAPSRFGWGERKVVAYVAGDKTARVQSTVVFFLKFGEKEKLAEMTEDVSIETARAIQKKWVAEAEKNDWVLLEPMREKREWRTFAQMPDGSICEVSTLFGDVHVAAEGGRKYYCEIRKGGWESSRIAVPKLEYFNLGGEETAKKISPEKAAPEEVADAVTIFNQKFGALKAQRKK